MTYSGCTDIDALISKYIIGDVMIQFGFNRGVKNKSKKKYLAGAVTDAYAQTKKLHPKII